MPGVWAHSFYWTDQGVSTVVIPPVISRGGYPSWQASIVRVSVAPSLPLGWLGAWWDEFRAAWKAFRTLGKRINALSGPRRTLLLKTLDHLESPLYDDARKAVRATATTIGFNDPLMWTEYSRALKGTPRRAENVFRHVKACDLVQKAYNQHGSTGKLANPYVNYLVELAYQEYSIQPWRD